MSLRRDFIKRPLAAAVLGALGLPALPSFGQDAVTLLNVSYDPTRELYVEFNHAFAKYWKGKTGQDVKRLPHNSSPYTSTIEFQRAPPEVLGLGVMTLMPGLTRSSQSLMPLGCPGGPSCC
jgi:ABC-type sulfate transport system substrate-binding protein